MEGVNYPLPLRIFLTLLIEGLVLMSRTGRYHLIKPQAPVFVGPIYKYLKFCVSNSMPAVTASVITEPWGLSALHRTANSH